MRQRLALVFVAVSAIVAIAFVVPLAYLVRSTAQDRAIDTARADAAAVTPALVAGNSPEQIEFAMRTTTAGTEGRMTVITAAGLIIGPPIEDSARVNAALMVGASAVGNVSGGKEVVAAVASRDGQLSAVRVLVTNDDLQAGQLRAWIALGLVAATLIGLSVLVADRLARTIVKPTQALGAAARRLGTGDLQTRVEPDGPTELVELAVVFNELGERISTMLDNERELIAELSHRLRTPLTVLAMRIAQFEGSAVGAELTADVEQLTKAINDLIEEARRSSPEKGNAACDIVQTVIDRAEFWSVLAEDQNRPWRFDTNADHAEVKLEREDLAATLDALIENVFAHTSEGVAVEVSVLLGDNEVRVAIGDAGPGFDIGLVEAGVSAGNSTGLGLHIARRFAIDAGGRLEVSRSELGGALVGLVLPISEPS